MIQLATPADARREISRMRNRVYSGRGFGPRSFECIGIQIGRTLDSGRTTAPAPSGNFAAAFNNTGIVQNLRSDLGLTTTGSIVNAWADQSGNGWNVAEGTATVGLGTVTAGLSGHAGIVGGTGGQYGKIAGLTLGVPSVTPTFFWGVGRLVTSPGGQGWLTTGVAGGGELLLFANAGANLSNYNGSFISSASAPVGSWGRIEALFNHSVTIPDYVKFAASSNSAGSAGNGIPGSTRYLFASPTDTNPGSWELLALITLNRIPTGTELTNAAALAQGFYGVSVGI